MTEHLPPGAFTAWVFNVFNVGFQRLQRRFIPLGRVSKTLFWWIQSWPNFLTFHIHVLGSQWYHFWCYWLSKSVKNHVFLSANLGIHSLRTTQMTANLLWLKYFKPAYRLLQNLFNPNFLLQSLITNVGKYLQIDVGF